MPAAPGEKLLLTLFGDIHYTFSSSRLNRGPHRFSRASYVYLYHNPATYQSKLEIADHAGTPEQDAFFGYLDLASLSYSYKQPNLISLSIDAAKLQSPETWHLPDYDKTERDRGSGWASLHTIFGLGIYLWTEKDAATLLGHLKAVLPPEKVNIRDAPPVKAPVEHRDSMSPIVQQLEQTAISAQHPGRADSTTSARSTQSARQAPAPPPAPASAPAPAPMAYNPAAPAAPEPIAHREKTPPPLDGPSGTGLQNAAKYDSFVPQQAPPQQYITIPSTNANAYANSAQTTPQGAYFPGAPPSQQQQQEEQQRQYQQQLQQQQLQQAQRQQQQQQQQAQQLQQGMSFPGPPQAGRPPPSSHNSTSPPAQQYAQTAPSFGPTAIASPGLPPYAPQQPQHLPPAYTPDPSQPQQTFGFSNYSYSQGASQPIPYGYSAHGGGYSGDVHAQVYRPTADEAAHGHGAPPMPMPQRQSTGGSDTRMRIEDRVRGVENKVGGYLKKLDRLL